MKCKDCSACRLGFFKSFPESYACLGTRHPFILQGINKVCCLYDEEERDWIKMNRKIHEHEIPENIIPYITVEFLRKLKEELYKEFGYGNRNAVFDKVGSTQWYECLEMACKITDDNINGDIVMQYHNSLVWHDADNFERLLCEMMGDII